MHARGVKITLALMLAVTVTAQAMGAVIGGFSTLRPGRSVPEGWRLVTLPEVAPTRFELVEDRGVTVVRALASGSAASLARSISADHGDRPVLSWRWRVDRVVSQGDVYTKQGDDFAARLYVSFDVPLARLSWLERNKLRLARWLYGEQLPAAALCYVWGNRTPLQTRVDNAYTERVKMFVLRNAASDVGAWVAERRDLSADFRAAFGFEAPPVSGIAISVDTDQTGESVNAWFGDIALWEADSQVAGGDGAPTLMP